MAGYQGYSKSNNAVRAESEGKVPKTYAKRLVVEELKKFDIKMTQAQVAAHSDFNTCEWHHTSSRYNCTDYYDIAEIAENIALEFHNHDYKKIMELPFSQFYKEIALRDFYMEKNACGEKTPIVDYLQIKRYPTLWNATDVLSFAIRECKAKPRYLRSGVKNTFMIVRFWKIANGLKCLNEAGTRRYFGI